LTWNKGKNCAYFYSALLLEIIIPLKKKDRNLRNIKMGDIIDGAFPDGAAVLLTVVNKAQIVC
jgi:hypothetical protein